MSEHASFQKRSVAPRPLNNKGLHELALIYVGRYATSKHKLTDYLKRKIRERPWTDDAQPAVEDIVAQLVALGYINDQYYAQQKAENLTRRGYGLRRIQAALYTAGIGDDDKQAALNIDESVALQAAKTYARKKKLGPYSSCSDDIASRKKHFAAMCRAGHDFAIVRQILDFSENFVQD